MKKIKYENEATIYITPFELFIFIILIIALILSILNSYGFI